MTCAFYHNPAGAAKELAYNPFEGFGTWTLYVNTKRKGCVENTFAPFLTEIPAYGRTFRFGAETGDGAAASFVGGIDMWRVTQGVLDGERLLDIPGSFMMIIQ